ncbi:methyl-accepting chemotaxis protein [Psychrosphaera aquimarina]|uniref:Methyl-accepting chemotaxis protein n=1 Tax=Psychrosphaera aquimarina TaxID=2044854 RepID=A0ABU3QZ41_9GAMM|nr:methyl-accepting chemotaxis protein [Psychrosphaera aquimarina]MDU0112708.1 methyl-accepting chemotaxis protein [Psychrosphaera aquimarina]
MKMSTRLIVGFGTLLLMMSLLTLIGINRVNSIDHILTQMTDVNSKKQRYAINFRGSVHDRAIALRDVVLVQSKSEFDATVKLIKDLDNFYQISAKALNREISADMHMNRKESEIYQRIQSIEKQSVALLDQVIKQTKNNNIEQAKQTLLNKARPAFVTWLNTINEFIDYQEGLNKVATVEARAVASGFQNWMIILTLVALILGAALAFFILKRIEESVGGEPQEAEDYISHIAQGDLTGSIVTKYNRSIMGSIVSMQSTLKKIVNNISLSSSELLQRAETVTLSSKSSLDLAEKQIRHTSFVVDSLQQMAERVKSIVNIVHQTESNSRETVSLSLSGREAVQKLANEIEDISSTVANTVQQVNLLDQTAKEIGTIINVIRSISDQTNLLALNAAIEAARAGEAGRGFAVVADEVRQLAQRTGDATGEIETMISQVQTNTEASVTAMETTVPKVERGLVLTKEASKLLDEIQQQANSSMENVLQVVNLTSKQESTIGDIKDSVTELDHMSKDTSMSLKESSEQADHLEKLSSKLSADIEFFKV